MSATSYESCDAPDQSAPDQSPGSAATKSAIGVSSLVRHSTARSARTTRYPRIADKGALSAPSRLHIRGHAGDTQKGGPAPSNPKASSRAARQANRPPRRIYRSATTRAPSFPSFSTAVHRTRKARPSAFQPESVEPRGPPSEPVVGLQQERPRMDAPPCRDLSKHNVPVCHPRVTVDHYRPPGGVSICSPGAESGHRPVTTAGQAPPLRPPR